MSRITHDLQHDHHGTLPTSSIAEGAAPITLGQTIGRYYASDRVVTVIADLDARLQAMSQGFSINAGSVPADGIITSTISAPFTCDAEIA